MENETLVLDASVIFKWFSQEKYNEQAKAIRDLFLDRKINIVVPDLMFYEFSNSS